ncbi:MAG: PEP-CTERM sorting domain-containing protein [Gammaproteobacteria bacterium]
MCKKRLSATVLALCAMSAHAAEPPQQQTYYWSYQGFFDVLANRFVADAAIEGKFDVVDADGNGVFDLSEVRSFDSNLMQCYPFQPCTLSAFSYDPKGELTFEFEQRRPYGWFGEVHAWIRANEAFSWHSESWGEYGLETWDSSYRWDPRTIATVNTLPPPLPVPEPHTYLMLGAGLLALAAATRYRRATMGTPS